LVYDVGMRLGEDTAWYLRRGFRVIGVEANPSLLEGLRARFRDELASGDLVIVDRAVGHEPGTARFAITPGQPNWGTLDRRFVQRFESTRGAVEYVEVEVVTFESILREHGVPYYLKVDIEGHDQLCVNALADVEDRPAFVSIESCATSPGATVAAARAEIGVLAVLGYERFAYVDQRVLCDLDGTELIGEGPPLRYVYENGASGPFGLDIPNRWIDAASAGAVAVGLVGRYHVLGFQGRYSKAWPSQALRRNLRRVGVRSRRAHLGMPRWYDLHAAHRSVVADLPS
jgi:FkbM family methyltransferase